MPTETITLEIDATAAQAFNSVSAELRAKSLVLMEIWLKELLSADGPSLLEAMDEIGEKARSRGLTAQELEIILRQE